MTELCHSPTTSENIARYSARDPIIAKVMYYINNEWPAKIEEQCKPYLRRRNELCINLSCLQWGNRVVILFQLCEHVINELHDCHPGIVRMKVPARFYFWWPSLDEIIEMCKTMLNMSSEPKHASISTYSPLGTNSKTMGSNSY